MFKWNGKLYNRVCCIGCTCGIGRTCCIGRAHILIVFICSYGLFVFATVDDGEKGGGIGHFSSAAAVTVYGGSGGSKDLTAAKSIIRLFAFDDGGGGIGDGNNVVDVAVVDRGRVRFNILNSSESFITFFAVDAPTRAYRGFGCVMFNVFSSKLISLADTHWSHKQYPDLCVNFISFRFNCSTRYFEKNFSPLSGGRSFTFGNGSVLNPAVTLISLMCVFIKSLLSRGIPRRWYGIADRSSPDIVSIVLFLVLIYCTGPFLLIQVRLLVLQNNLYLHSLLIEGDRFPF